ncbi:MAG: MMPL family transporter [Chloroflexi bacterium]|nr:MAG: MMPL family transporter [Chloroflexota bacterium]
MALAIWVGVLIGLAVGSRLAGSDYRNDFSLPGTESQRALDALKEHSPAESGDTVSVVLQDRGGLRAPPTRERVEQLLRDVRGLPHVSVVRDPYADTSSISPDGTTGYATVVLDGRSEDVPAQDVRRMIDTARADGGDGLRVELGGAAVRSAEAKGGGAAEGVGLLAALAVLVLLFGSLLAASLPLVVAIFAVGSSIGLIALASHLTTVADFTQPTMILVGLGVGIDYALLVFSRYRAELIGGADREQAVRRALDTAGRTVFFAGGTVIIALLGLVVLGLGSLQGTAIAVAVTVLVTMLASLMLLPSLLAIMGERIERGVRRRAARARRPEGGRWRAWSGWVQRRPWPAALLAAAALLALASPALGLRLGLADAGNDLPSSTSRQAYDLLAGGFGRGFNGPLVVVTEGDSAAAATAQHALAGTPGVAAVTPPLPSRDGRVTTLLVFPDSKPQDARTHRLLAHLRQDVLPPLERDTGATFLVGGPTAATVDFSSAVAARLPLFVAVVVGLSALLLLAVFRSLLVPLKAALLNLLSVAAALGVITLVFQDGVLGGPLGVEPGPVEAFVPVMIFAIAFGLSMDYEVFLLSRMREEWERTGDAPMAVREGLANTGRVVTSAAAIMVVVFGAFLLDPSRLLKQFGLGLATAVLLDALVIRCLIVTAVMQLFGTRAWWLPGWAARRLPRLGLDRPHPELAADLRVRHPGRR